MVEESTGAIFRREEGGVRPPLEAEEGAEAGAGAEEEARIEGALRAGKVPLHPAFVRLPLRAEGVILHQFTGYPGFEYDEGTLNDLAEMAQQLDIELNPTWQFLVALLAAHAVKFLGYAAWRKAGKPKLTETGELVKEKQE